MYAAESHGIRVAVRPEFLPDRSDPEGSSYFWAYRVAIENHGDHTLKLLNRYWRIVDAVGRVEEVRGPGVVGRQPTLRPGERFEYTSGCPLKTSSGIMSGHYEMVDDAGMIVEVVIPAFSLDSPYANGVVN